MMLSRREAYLALSWRIDYDAKNIRNTHADFAGSGLNNRNHLRVVDMKLDLYSFIFGVVLTIFSMSLGAVLSLIFGVIL